ncbi:serine/threonine protein phosphatase, partial [Rhizobium sp. BR5]
IGFMDFEERPQDVMPLATAQARDIWLLFLQVATRACNPPET